MANSKYEYVRAFEKSTEQYLVPNTFVVVRIDGRGFHKFTARHSLTKPNDARALHLMNAAATAVVSELADITLAYGVSDEFSFVLRRGCALFERRAAKIVTTIASTFTAYYVHLWREYFPDTPLTAPLPSFDGRAVVYPGVAELRDYVAWRQVDCHINNLYNTTFWALIQRGGMSAVQAEEALQRTVAADKNEILFKRFGINYNDEPEMFRKGSVIYREYEEETIALLGDEEEELSKTRQKKIARQIRKADVVTRHVDVIKDAFWEERPWLLAN
ncbi:Thg1 C terminal domain-containing protein [Geopyxis carbonaria]|nr:Thg1 C terminal domain-containing protein [Geopyxis carbonaria]